MDTQSCTLCAESPGTVARGELWTGVLNRNQTLIGRTYFKLNRHETDVTRLSEHEQSELFYWFARTRSALDRLFAPDHYNYVMLMNVESHAHAHIIPRFELPRTFGGETFADANFGDHYDPHASLILADAQFKALAEAVTAALGEEVSR